MAALKDDFYLLMKNYILHLGQNLFLKLLKGELPESQKAFTIKDIGEETLGFSSLNFPDMKDFNVSEDYPYIAAQASGSCPNQCSFCNEAAYWVIGHPGETEADFIQTPELLEEIKYYIYEFFGY